jgi:hypothetical protein
MQLVIIRQVGVVINGSIGQSSFIGYWKQGNGNQGSNKLYIANSSTSTPLIYGDFSTGNVGIGTNNPSTKLEVNGQVKITEGNPGLGKILTSDATGLASWQNPVGDNLGNHTASQNINLNGNALVSGGSRGIKIDSRGNIGINMDPQNVSGNDVFLDLKSPDGWGHANIRMHGYNWATNIYKCTRGSGCEFYTGAFWSDTYNEHLFILSSDGANFGNGITLRKNGNIGIGNQAPNYKLDVTGDINFTGNIRKNGTAIVMDGSETKINAGSDITITGNGTTATPYIINAAKPKFYLGQDTLGGIVFYIYLGADGQQHGLIVSK